MPIVQSWPLLERESKRRTVDDDFTTSHAVTAIRALNVSPRKPGTGVLPGLFVMRSVKFNLTAALNR